MSHNLAEVMRRRHCNVEQLVDRTGISRRSIYNWLDGRAISSAYLVRVARALGVVPEEIQPPEIAPPRRLYGTEDPYPVTRYAKARR